MTDAPPSAWRVERVMSLAMETLSKLRTDDGQIIETEDETFAALSEEGVDAETILCRIVRAALEAKAFAVATDTRIADLRARRERFLRQEQILRATAQGMMECLNLTKYRAADFSLTVTDARPKLHIVNENEIPDEFVDIVIVRSPDKALIKEALERGHTVPGATLSNQSSVLTVRTK